MIFIYGKGLASEYAFAINEATVNTIRRTRNYNKRNRRRSTVVRMHVAGRLKGDTVAALTTSINGMEAGFLTGLDGAKAGLYEDDGSTETAHMLDPTGSIDGIRCTEIQYNRSGGAEYASGRSFGIMLEVEYRQDGIGGQVQEFRESMRTVGTGGVKRRIVEDFSDFPEFQTLAGKSAQFIYQEGWAVGFGGYPLVIPDPYYPANELFDQRQVHPVSPRSHIGGYFDWGWRWSYVMARSVAVPGLETPATPSFL